MNNDITLYNDDVNLTSKRMAKDLLLDSIDNEKFMYKIRGIRRGKKPVELFQ